MQFSVVELFPGRRRMEIQGCSREHFPEISGGPLLKAKNSGISFPRQISRLKMGKFPPKAIWEARKVWKMYRRPFFRTTGAGISIFTDDYRLPRQGNRFLLTITDLPFRENSSGRRLQTCGAVKFVLDDDYRLPGQQNPFWTQFTDLPRRENLISLSRESIIVVPSIFPCFASL